MGIGEEEEEGFEGVLRKVIGEKLHGVGANHGDILISAGGDTEGGDAIMDILGDLDADFKPKDEFVWKLRGKGDEETTESTADVGKGGGLF